MPRSLETFMRSAQTGVIAKAEKDSVAESHGE
jgi:hypothetical protein